MKIDSSKTIYKDYDCYLNIHRKMNRMQVCMKNRLTRKQRTLLYSKFIVSCGLGRELSRQEEVDHIDGDKTNDKIDNLKITTRSENIKKYLLSRKRKTKEICCKNCLKTSTKYENNVLYKNNKNGFFCSKKCFYEFLRKRP